VAWIELENAVNVRDVGGVPAGDDQKVAPGRLIRSDNLQDLSPDDVRLLVEELGLTTVIDLRSAPEVASEGPGPLRAVESVEHLHFSVLPESHGMTDASADALAVGRERAMARDPEDLLGAFYQGYLEDRPDSIVGALRAIAAAPGAALVHCAAGKDRTGVIVAMALSAVGVPRDLVVADYALTAERIGAVLDRLRSSPTYASDVDALPDEEHRPKAATMERFLASLDARGGVLEWLDAHGFGSVDVEALRAKLVTKGLA
jgi:protein tyrosine/serine phosphatase